MRRIVTTMLGLVLATGLFSAPVTAAKWTVCTVEPNPVSISAADRYTVTATGGVPFELYEIIISQKFDGVTDEGRDWLGQADENGVVSHTFTAYAKVDGDPSGLLVGDARVAVSRYRTGGGPGGAASTISRCKFMVIE